MTYLAWDISSAADYCYRVAIDNGWECLSPRPDVAHFWKGDRWVILNLAINGGITRVGTDRGAYDGPNRKAWAIEYLKGTQV